MPKNIVVCCDGTNNKFGVTNTNVVKLYSTLVYQPGVQLAYYHPGVGTLGAPNALTKFSKWWTQLFGSAFGYGITDAIGDAYRYLMDQFEDGDRVFIFGFSRGAYTARALAGMLHMFGLIRKGNESLIPYATKTMKHLNEEAFQVAPQFKAAFSRECKPHFVGVWDTVGSVGWLYDPVKLPYSANNPDIAIGRHAISIDERRCMFRQNLWGDPKPGQDYKQVWFAGVHCDVGGGYAESECGLSKIALAWILDEAEAAGLIVDSQEASRELGLNGSGVARPDPKGMLHRSLSSFWWILEFWPKPHKDMRFTPPKTKWGIGLGQRRFIRDGATIHKSVLVRMEQLPDYRPNNLPRTYEIEPWQNQIERPVGG
jgi:uncharacterized protein (DUF2235 family)